MNDLPNDYNALIRRASIERSAYLGQLLRRAARKLNRLFPAQAGTALAGGRIGGVRQLPEAVRSNQNQPSKAA